MSGFTAFVLEMWGFVSICEQTMKQMPSPTPACVVWGMCHRHQVTMAIALTEEQVSWITLTQGIFLLCNSGQNHQHMQSVPHTRHLHQLYVWLFACQARHCFTLPSAGPQKRFLRDTNFYQWIMMLVLSLKIKAFDIS